MRIALRLGGLIAATTLAALQTVTAAAAPTRVTIPAPDLVNPCNGELITTTGNLLVVTGANDDRHLHTRSRFEQVTGVGAVTGATYKISGINLFQGNFDLPTGQSTFMTLITMHVVAPGTGQHFSSTFMFHEIATPNGRHVILVSHDKSICHSSDPAAATSDSPGASATGATPSNGLAPSGQTQTAPTAPATKSQAPAHAASPTTPGLGSSHGVRAHGNPNKAF